MKNAMHNRRGRARSRAGFSVIELLVVISLIIILVALLINTVIENRGPIMATRSTMQVLHNVETEYRVLSGLPPINHYNYPLNSSEPLPQPFFWSNNPGHPTNAFDDDGDPVVGTGIPDHSIERFIWAVMQVPDIRQMLEAQDISLIDSDDDGYLEVLDGWENKIEYLGWNSHDASRGVWNESAPLDEAYEVPFDPSIAAGQRLNLRHPERGSKEPERRSPHFASPGRDGKWGNATITDTTREEYKQTRDNIYSYDIE